MPETNLRPCPFCGGKPKRKSAKYHTLGIYGGIEKQWYNVCCSNCGISQPFRKYFSREDADEAWNRRTENETD